MYVLTQILDYLVHNDKGVHNPLYDGSGAASTPHTAGGMTYWYKDDTKMLHRCGGLPAVESITGEKEYWVDGERHRGGDLPAIDHGKYNKQYWVGGKLHRLGGKPALEQHLNGKWHLEWYVNGIEVSEPKEDPSDVRCFTLKDIYAIIRNKINK